MTPRDTDDDLHRQDIEKQLSEDFDRWFAELQTLSSVPLDPDDWFERWFDHFTPAEALEDGPEDEEAEHET